MLESNKNTARNEGSDKMTKFINELSSETAILLLSEWLRIKEGSDLALYARKKRQLETMIRTALNDNGRSMANQLFCPPSSLGTGVYKLYYEGPARKMFDYVKERLEQGSNLIERSA